MKRATITLDDDLEQALDRYLESLEATPTLTSVVQAALRRYFEQLGVTGPREIAESGAGYDEDRGDLELDSETALLLRQAAAEEGVPPTRLVRSVLRDYLRDRKGSRPVGVGKYHSGRSDIGSRAEEILRRAARSRR